MHSMGSAAENPPLNLDLHSSRPWGQLCILAWQHDHTGNAMPVALNVQQIHMLDISCTMISDTILQTSPHVQDSNTASRPQCPFHGWGTLAS